MIAPLLDLDQPVEQDEPFLNEIRVTEREAAGDPRLGEPRVVVGETCLGPGPVGAVGEPPRRGAARSNRAVAQPVAGMRGRDLRRAEHGVGVRAWDAASEARCSTLEAGERPGGRAPRCRCDSDAEPEEGVPFESSDRRRPSSRLGVGGEPVVEAAVVELRSLEECEAGEGEPLEHRRRSGSRETTASARATSSVQ